MEKELLQQALNSILHGSTQTISDTDYNGNAIQRVVVINDLRVQLVEKIAQKLVQTDEFKKAICDVFTPSVIKQIQEKAIGLVSFDDLDYSVKDRIKNQIKTDGYEVKKYKIVAEVVEDAFK